MSGLTRWWRQLGGHDLRRLAGAEQARSHERVKKKFIEVDNQEAVKMGDLERYTEVIKVVKPSSRKAIFPNVSVREGVDELTVREGEAGMLSTFMDTTSVGNSRWEPPLVDED